MTRLTIATLLLTSSIFTVQVNGDEEMPKKSDRTSDGTRLSNAPSMQTDGFRVWTDSRGRTARAQYVTHSASDAALKLRDVKGRLYTIRLGSLAESDRRFVQTLQESHVRHTAISMAVLQQQPSAGIEKSDQNDAINNMMRSAIQTKPTVSMRARFIEQSNVLFAQVEEKRRKDDQVISVITKTIPVDVVKYCWYRCGIFGRRRICRRVVVREYREVKESRVSEQGLEWDDSRVGKTDLNDTTIHFVALPPTTGARLDFIRTLLRRHAKADVDDEIPLATNIGVVFTTTWQTQSDGINERQYYYQGSIVSELADAVAFEVRVKERPVGFNSPDDYIPVSNLDATAEYRRVAEEIGFSLNNSDEQETDNGIPPT